MLLEQEINWFGDTAKQAVFYSTLPFTGMEPCYNVMEYIDREQWDYVIDQPDGCVDGLRFDQPQNILEMLKKYGLAGAPGEPGLATRFERARSFHDGLTTHEIVFMRGLYAVLDEPFWSDGVGYAGTLTTLPYADMLRS